MLLLRKQRKSLARQSVPHHEFTDGLANLRGGFGRAGCLIARRAADRAVCTEQSAVLLTETRAVRMAYICAAVLVVSDACPESRFRVIHVSCHVMPPLRWTFPLSIAAAAEQPMDYLESS